MAEHTPRPDQPRLRPAPLLFEPAQAASDPEHFFDLESIEDPRALLERATELTLAFRAAADRATEFQAMAAAQLADPGASTGCRRRTSPSAPSGPRTTRSGWSSSAATCCAAARARSTPTPCDPRGPSGARAFPRTRVAYAG